MEILGDVIKYLGLKKRIEIKIHSRSRDTVSAKYWGLYGDRSGKLVAHRIHVYGFVHADRSLETILAHELIHAWQEEHGLKEIHGPEFRRLAIELGHEFGIRRIYIEGQDL